MKVVLSNAIISADVVLKSPNKKVMKLIKVLYLHYLWVVALLFILSTCDAIDVMDPNFNDRNIGVWEKWTEDNNYTYIEISENEVTFYFYNDIYRCSIVERFTILDIQANGVYTLQIIGSDEVNIMGFSRNDRFLHVRDLNTDIETEETQIFNPSSKNLDDLDKACGTYPFLGVWERDLSQQLTAYLYITEELIDVIAYLKAQNCYSMARLTINSITEVEGSYKMEVQEEADTSGETAEEVEIFIFPDYMLLKRIENGFPITETYQPSDLDITGQFPSCSL
ncbi:MAG: hypothetical protein CL672_07230 [Balneola sp.]|nr:hypothetical protein [Balneola sp.]